MRLTPIASATSSTARRRMNAPRSSSSRIARCLSSRDSVGSSSAELGLDRVDQAVERTVQRRQPDRADLLPSQISGTSLASRRRRDERRADRVDHRRTASISGWMRRVHGSRSTWTFTWVAPLASARRDALVSGPASRRRRRTTTRTGRSRRRRRAPARPRPPPARGARLTFDERLDRELDPDHADRLGRPGASCARAAATRLSARRPAARPAITRAGPGHLRPRPSRGAAPRSGRRSPAPPSRRPR